MKERSSATRILVGLLVGAAAGVAVNAWLGPDDARVQWFAKNVAAKVGEIFLRLLFMIVVPMIFTSLTLGVAGLGGMKGLGRVGAKTIAWFVVTTAFAALLGIALVNAFKPGATMGHEVTQRLLAQSGGEAQEKLERGRSGTGFSVQTLVNVIPKNPIQAAAGEDPSNPRATTAGGDMLGVIFFALMVGLAATKLPAEKAAPFLAVLQSLYDLCVVIIGFAMKLAPLGVAGLMFEKTALFGAAILQSLAAYVLVALCGLAFWQFVVLGGLARLFGGVPVRRFFSRSRGLMATAFSTSSSNATLPTTIRTAREEFGVPSSIAGFVLPLGATLNMNGTALFEGVAVLFLAQVSGIELSVAAQATVVVLAVLTAIGAAGVPGGSLPLIATVLVQVGIEPSMLAVILGVDRLVDMARTVPNVTGDLVCSLWVARGEERRLAAERREP